MSVPVTSTDVVIVGSGFAGLCMAIRLKAAGNDRFIVLERGPSIGGTWRDNRYPGCACDIPAILYSFSFAPKTDWNRTYPTQPEILDYLERCAERFGVGEHIRFGADVASARYDEERARWFVATRDGREFAASVLVSAMGGLSNPHVPDIPGASDFAGPRFHSAAWNDVPLDGLDVAVIGTGASAVQIVPAIAPRARSLRIFQRTAPWVLPKRDVAIGRTERTLRRVVPAFAWTQRMATYWQHEARALGFAVEPALLERMERPVRAFLRRQIPDPALRAKVTPGDRMGCRRVLISSEYYPALCRSNVSVVTEPIAHLERDAVVTADGVRHTASAVIYATGFRAQDGGTAAVFGVGGRPLADAWRDGMQAYLGTSVSGFPNLFFLVGPNSGLGHNSMIYMIESHVNYVMSALSVLRRHRGGALDVRSSVQRRFNDALERRMRHTVWTTGCRSWYLDPNGKNTTLWPGFTFEFRSRTRRLVPRRYRLSVGRRSDASDNAAAPSKRPA